MKKIFSLMAILFLTVGLFGCGTPKPEPVVEKFCESLKTFDIETINSLLVNGSEENTLEESENLRNEELVNIFTQFNDEIKYQLIETTMAEDKESAQISVEFEYVDAYNVGAEAFTLIITEALTRALGGIEVTEEDMLDIMAASYQAALEEKETAMTKTIVTFDLALVENEWKILEAPYEILHVATANFLKPMEDGLGDSEE